MKPGRMGNIWRQEGIKGITDRVIRRFYRRTNLYEIDISGEVKVPDEPDMVMETMTTKTLAQMIRDYPDEIPEDKRKRLAKRLAPVSTDKVFLVREQDGVILGFYCSAYDDHYDDTMNYRVPARKGNVFLFDGYTFLIHRNKGAQKFATFAMLAEGKGRGCTTATTMVDEKNVFSEKAVIKSGFTKAAVIHHYYAGPLKGNIQRER